MIGTNTRMSVSEAWRSVRRAPGATLAVLALLTAIFSAQTLVWGLAVPVFRPNPGVSDLGTLVQVLELDRRSLRTLETLPAPLVRDWMNRSTALADVAAYELPSHGAVVVFNHEAVPVTIAYVTTNFFQTLGVRPIIGRVFEPPYEQGVIISHGFWQTHYGSRPDILEEKMSIGAANPVPILGVMPVDFGFPSGASVWRPMQTIVRRSRGWAALVRDWDVRDLRVVGRIAPGSSIEQVQSELATITSHTGEAYRLSDLNEPAVVPLATALYRRTRPVVLAAGVGLAALLGLAILNAACFTWIRSRTQVARMLTKIAVGATQGQMRWEPVVEGCGIVTLAFVLSVPATRAWILLLESRGLSEVPGLPSFGGVASAYVATAITAVIVGAALGLGTAHFNRRAAHAAIRRRRSDTGRRALTPLVSLLAIQAAGAVGLAAAALTAVLLVQAHDDRDRGFSPAGLVTAQVNLLGTASESFPAQIDDMVTRLGGLPGIEGVAVTTLAPFRGQTLAEPVGVRRGSAPEGKFESTYATPKFFEVTGMQFAQGQSFSSVRAVADNVPGEDVPVVLNTVLAKDLLGGTDVIGALIDLDRRTGVVTGVVAPAILDPLRDDPIPEMYVPLNEHPRGQVTVLLRERNSGVTSANALRAAVREINPSAAVFNIERADTAAQRVIAPMRLGMAALSSFAVVALLIAVVGVLGVVSVIVAHGRTEFAVRNALGATSGSLIRSASLPIAAAIVSGVTAGCVATYGLRAVLVSTWHVTLPWAVWPLGISSAVVVLVCLAGALVPLRRLLRIDPSELLRTT